mgnify:CR=1 FL=1
MKKILIILLIIPIFGYSKDLKISKQIGFDGKNLIYKDTSFIIQYECNKIKIANKEYSVKRNVSIDYDSELVIDEYLNKNIKLILKIDVMNSSILQIEIWKKPFDYVQIFRL